MPYMKYKNWYVPNCEIAFPTEEEAWELLYSGGLTIYSTVDTNLQSVCEEIANNPKIAKYIDSKNVPMWIRHVVVPGLTDTEEENTKLAEFVAQLNNVQAQKQNVQSQQLDIMKKIILLQ